MKIKSSLSAFTTIEDWYEEVRSQVKTKGGPGTMFALVPYQMMESFRANYLSGELPEKLADSLISNKT